MLLPYSTVTYVGNGATASFAVPFPYVSQSDVIVTVNGVAATFSWPNSTTVTITPTPGVGASVYIYRTTAIGTASITFPEGSTLRAADLNTEFTQVLYGIQEAWDQTIAVINADRATVGALPVVVVGDNTKVLQVTGGVWTVTTPATFVGTLPHDTSISVAGSQLAVAFTTTGGLTNVAGGLRLLLADASLQVSVSGASVQFANNGGLVTAAGGLTIKGFPIVSADSGSPADADNWYNSTNKVFRYREAGATVGSVGCVFRNTADSTAIANTLTHTACSLGWPMPANFLTAGKSIRVRFGGNYTATGVATNLTINLFLNGLASGVDGQTFSTGTATAGNFTAEFVLTCRTTGAGGTFGHTGHICFAGSSTTFQPFANSGLPINTTVINTVNPSFQWGTASASNSVKVTEIEVEVLD